MSGGMYGKGPKGKATRLHSLVVRSRGKCERCGETDYARLQCAHIIPRRYTATRTDETASWCLCAKCHLATTELASEHMALVDRTIGRERFDELLARARAGRKSSDAYWREECERLGALLVVPDPPRLRIVIPKSPCTCEEPTDDRWWERPPHDPDCPLNPNGDTAA